MLFHNFKKKKRGEQLGNPPQGPQYWLSAGPSPSYPKPGKLWLKPREPRANPISEGSRQLSSSQPAKGNRDAPLQRVLQLLMDKCRRQGLWSALAGQEPDAGDERASGVTDPFGELLG